MSLFFRFVAMAALVIPVGGQPNPGGTHMEAKGTFEVKVTPVDPTAFEKGMGAGRYEVDKTWAGDFAGKSKGEMLTSFTETTGSMAYVAIEQVTGALAGKTGIFYLSHTATMTKGNAASGEMHIVVVKGSGTGELAGIRGQLKIIIDATGKHSYVFDYELP